MSSLAAPSPEPGNTKPTSAKTWTVGTLSYNQQGLIIVFFWLMWNDFSITLIEQIEGLNGFLMLDHGANLTQMALLGMLGFFLPWLNPWVSTWSDRHRGRFGRRRPFLFIATPFFAFFLGLYPYMPTIYYHVQHNPMVELMVRHLPDQMNGAILFMGLCGLIAGIFNAVVKAIFSYLYWDVVPEALMGRFQSLSKIAVLLASQVWLFFIYGQGRSHSKTVYTMTAFFCLIVYLVSVWQIKESEYPPPDPHKKGGAMAPIRAYFVECFSKAYFLWIFVASLFTQLGNQGGGPQSYYMLYDLHIDLTISGPAAGMANMITTGFGMVFGFFVGTLTDKLKPVRLIGPSYILLSLLLYVMYFYIHDVWSFMICATVRGLINFCQGVIIGAFTIEVFPREKLGQFCSAQAVFYQVIIMLLSVPIAQFFDFVHGYYHYGFRIGYVWSGMFYALAALCYFKVYFNWKNRHGEVPVPHAG